MSGIALATWDGGGNVPPLLHIGVELQARGHEVRVLGHATQEGRFAAAGLSFVSYRHALPFSRTDPFDDLAVFTMFADGGAGQDLDELLTDWSADTAVIDCLMLGPLQAAQARGLPTVALVHSFWRSSGRDSPRDRSPRWPRPMVASRGSSGRPPPKFS